MYLSTQKKRILIADRSDEILHALQAVGKYELAHAKNGEDALSKLSSFKPHLVFTALMVPGMDGIEIIRRLRAHPESAKIGAIIVSYQPLIQVYHAAFECGADYFQVRPCTDEQIRSLAERWFEGVLAPDPLPPLSSMDAGGHCYVPRIHTPDHYIRFWGTRGSTPVAGAEYVRYGGNSPCLEIRSGDDLVIIDAGTGIRPLGEELAKQGVRRLHLILG